MQKRISNHQKQEQKCEEILYEEITHLSESLRLQYTFIIHLLKIIIMLHNDGSYK